MPCDHAAQPVGRAGALLRRVGAQGQQRQALAQRRQQWLPLALLVGPEDGSRRALVVLVVVTSLSYCSDESIKHGDDFAHRTPQSSAYATCLNSLSTCKKLAGLKEGYVVLPNQDLPDAHVSVGHLVDVLAVEFIYFRLIYLMILVDLIEEKHIEKRQRLAQGQLVAFRQFARDESLQLRYVSLFKSRLNCPTQFLEIGRSPLVLRVGRDLGLRLFLGLLIGCACLQKPTKETACRLDDLEPPPVKQS